MDWNKRCLLRKLIVAALWAVLYGTLEAGAQFGPLISPSRTPQARSKEELDAYLDVVIQKNPQKILQEVKSFLAQYPDSKLAGLAYEYEMEAWLQLNNFEGALSAGEKALTTYPDNLTVLLDLASAIALRAGGRPDRDQLLTRAEAYAQRALQEIDRTRISRQVTLEHWETMRRAMQAQAHEVLGSVALQRGQKQAAVSELETAVHSDPDPRGVEFLELGLAYRMANDEPNAQKAFHQAVELGPDIIRKRAADELRKSTAKGPPH